MPLRPPKGLSSEQIAAIERFAERTGIGPLFSDEPPCHGYANGCRCPRCADLKQQIDERGFTRDGQIRPPEAPPQPWTENS